MIHDWLIINLHELDYLFIYLFLTKIEVKHCSDEVKHTNNMIIFIDESEMPKLTFGHCLETKKN